MSAAGLVSIEEEHVGNVSSPFLPRHTTSEDGAWNLAQFRHGLTCQITSLSSERIELDLVGVDASIANAIRRVLIAEVPTVAVEHVYVFKNTSIVQDEVLAHRLGLVPIGFDPDLFTFKDPGQAGDDENTLVFLLNASCTRNPQYKKNGRHVSTGKLETDPLKLYDNAHVTSGMMIFSPQGGQADWNWASPNNPSGAEPAPVNKDIVLAKLRPGQSVEMELHCVKGVGKDHAKFSPVATATYRLLPAIDILRPIGQTGDRARDAQLQAKFKACFPEGVIGTRPAAAASSSSSGNGGSGQEEVYVADARKDTVSREVLRHPEFKDAVKLGRVRDHFLFDIESTGIIPPQRLLLAALKVLTEKVDRLTAALDSLEAPAEP